MSEAEQKQTVDINVVVNNALCAMADAMTQMRALTQLIGQMAAVRQGM